MAATVDLWAPPEGMSSMNIKAWRAFYSRTMDTYGLTPARYRLLYLAQRGRCWICRTARGIHPDDPKARGSRRLGVDHDHVTGKIRGLLCSGGDKTCNRVIGWLTARQLRRAAEYLEGVHPVAALRYVDDQIANADSQGVQLSQAEIDGLATNVLWGSREAL